MIFRRAGSPECVPFGGMSFSLIGVVIGFTHRKRGKIHKEKYGHEIVARDQVMDDVPLGKHQL